MQPQPQSLENAIQELDGLEIEELRLRWRAQFGRAAPPHLGKSLLFRILAYQMQAEILGDLLPRTMAMLGDAASGKSTKKSDRTSAETQPGQLQPGTVLVRELNGASHHVIVVTDGFAWNGTTYRSLSKVAEAISGTKWNGPRFFGLRAPARLEALSQ